MKPLILLTSLYLLSSCKKELKDAVPKPTCKWEDVVGVTCSDGFSTEGVAPWVYQRQCEKRNSTIKGWLCN